MPVPLVWTHVIAHVEPGREGGAIAELDARRIGHHSPRPCDKLHRPLVEVIALVDSAGQWAEANEILARHAVRL